MATRYTDELKKELVDFVIAFDEENGRGGQSAAKKKFKINPISIKKWCVEYGHEVKQFREAEKKVNVSQTGIPMVLLKPGRG